MAKMHIRHFQQGACISAIINSNGFPCSWCSYYFADAVLHLLAMEKLRRLIVRKLLQRFYVAPVS